MYLYVTDALKIMVDVKGSNEVICQSNTHDKRTWMARDTTSSEHRQLCAHLASLPPLRPELLFPWNASALYSVLLTVV